MMHIYDLAGVGLGPFNLSLAALAEPAGLDTVFLDGRDEFRWHPGLLIDGTTLQVPFLADLVTMVDPTSRWSFLNYLRQHDRLFPFYFAERFHVPRREYDHYCRWVAESLPSCRFGARVHAISWDRQRGAFAVAVEGQDTVYARNVVLGVGTGPVIPGPLAALAGEHVYHAGEYLGRLPGLAGARDVTVVGSGQSGAEVFLDLLRRQREAGWRLRWITRSRAFAPMEYSKLGLEHFTPDYTRYFYGLPEATKDRLFPSQWQLYKAASVKTLADIHDELYERGVGGGAADAELLPCVAVESARAVDGQYRLTCRHREQDVEFGLVTDRVILATGYEARTPGLIEPLAPAVDRRGRLVISPDYRLSLRPEVAGSVFVQNAETHTHGVGAPDLGLGAWRSATILNTLSGREVYRLPKRTAYTTFGAPGSRAL